MALPWYLRLSGTVLSTFGVGPKATRGTLDFTALTAARNYTYPDLPGQVGPNPLVTQAAHGFTAGQALKYNGAGVYALACADTAADAEVAGLVQAPTANTFVLALDGVVTGLSGLTDGAVYFLSPATPGALTATDPAASGAAGQVSKPLLTATGATTGLLLNYRGLVVAPAAGAAVVGPAPLGPTGLTAAAGNAQAVLSWTAASGAANYRVYQSASAATGPWTLAGTTTAGATTLTATGLTNGTTCYFCVCSVSAAGDQGPYQGYASAVPYTTYLSDTFTGAGSVALASHTPDVGGPWTVQSGTWAVSGGVVTQSASGAGNYFATADSGHADGSLTCDFLTPTNASFAVGAVFRWVSAASQWQLYVEADGGTPYVALNDGTAVRVRYNLPSYTPGDRVSARVVYSGSSLTLTANGAAAGSYTSTLNQTATVCGLLSYAAGGYSGGSQDNFQVTS